MTYALDIPSGQGGEASWLNSLNREVVREQSADEFEGSGSSIECEVKQELKQWIRQKVKAKENNVLIPSPLPKPTDPLKAGLVAREYLKLPEPKTRTLDRI